MLDPVARPDRIPNRFNTDSGFRVPYSKKELEMSTMNRKLRLEWMERRECPSATPAVAAGGPPIPQAIAADIANLSTALSTAAGNFLAHTPAGTEARGAITVLVDTAKLASDVRAETHAGLGGMIAPLVRSEINQATLYFDLATGNTAGAQAAAAKEQNDLVQLGNSLAGTQNAGLAAEVFSQVEFDFMNTDNQLFGVGVVA
jgi:hypothetical protein